MTDRKDLTAAAVQNTDLKVENARLQKVIEAKDAQIRDLNKRLGRLSIVADYLSTEANTRPLGVTVKRNV